MSGPKPGGAPNMSAMPSIGGGEVPDETAMQQMMGGASAGAANTSGGQTTPTPAPSATPPTPREVTSIKEETKQGLGDIWSEVKKFFSLNTWTGINTNSMTPEQQAEAKQFHARYQQLNQDQQAVAKQMFQEKMQKKKIQEEEDQQRKQIEAQKKQTMSMPSGPQKGPKGQGGGKKGAMQHLQDERTTIGKMQGE